MAENFKIERQCKGLRITTGILQIVFSLFLAFLPIVLLFAYAFAASIIGAISGGTETIDANNILNVSAYVFFVLSILTLVNGILLLPRKPIRKKVIAILNCIYMVGGAVLSFLIGGGIIVVGIVFLVLFMLNLFIAIFVNINNKKLEKATNIESVQFGEN